MVNISQIDYYNFVKRKRYSYTYSASKLEKICLENSRFSFISR